jgi:hypothetical protein
MSRRPSDVHDVHDDLAVADGAPEPPDWPAHDDGLALTH